MTKKVNCRDRESKLLRYMKAPFRFLVKARDMYVKGMVQCSRNLSYVDATTGCPTSGQLYAIPRSFSVNSARSNASADDDFKELVRVASLRTGDRVAKKVPRSCSVGIERIEEDEEQCEFGDDDIKVKPLLYSRSRSHAIRSGVGLF